MKNLLSILLLALLAISSSGCIEKKIRDLESPCAANSMDASAVDPCVRRPVNIGII